MVVVGSYIYEDDILNEGDQPELVDVWMEKATAINKVCKDFFTVSLY